MEQVVGPWIERERALKADLQAARDIGDSFWAALKPLNLQRINVSDPGYHVTEVIQRCAELERYLVACVEGWTKGDDVFGPMHRARALLADPTGQRVAEEWRALTALVPIVQAVRYRLTPEEWAPIRDALAAVEQSRQR